MANGYFILSVRKSGNESFGILETGETAQRFKYDDASRDSTNRRAKVLEIVERARDHWSTNYAPYANASFRIEDVDLASGEVKLLSGPAYERRTAADHNMVRNELVTLAHAAPARYKKTAVGFSDYLFLQADRAIPSQTAWRTLGLDERIELVREVAAGVVTPAIA